MQNGPRDQGNVAKPFDLDEIYESLKAKQAIADQERAQRLQAEREQATLENRRLRGVAGAPDLDEIYASLLAKQAQADAERAQERAAARAQLAKFVQEQPSARAQAPSRSCTTIHGGTFIAGSCSFGEPKPNGGTFFIFNPNDAYAAKEKELADAQAQLKAQAEEIARLRAQAAQAPQVGAAAAAVMADHKVKPA